LSQIWDVIVVGAGTARIPAAVFAAGRGARGINDTPDAHYEDVMRISRCTANPGLVRLAVGGIHVMPAIVFGRLLGAKILAWPGSAEAAA
jgi:hypothetical protein